MSDVSTTMIDFLTDLETLARNYRLDLQETSRVPEADRRRRQILAAVEEAGQIEVNQLHALAEEIGMDPRGLGGFFRNPPKLAFVGSERRFVRLTDTGGQVLQRLYDSGSK